MNGDQKKVSTLTVLIIVFLSFSFYLYAWLPVPSAPVQAQVLAGISYFLFPDSVYSPGL